jgi:hypothetical protein
MYPQKDLIPLLPPKPKVKLNAFCPSSKSLPHSARFTAGVSALEAIEFNWTDGDTPFMKVCYMSVTVVQEKDSHITFPIISSCDEPVTSLPANEWVLIPRNKARALWDLLNGSGVWNLTNLAYSWKETAV